MAYEIYTLNVPRTWPRRLLHIPSMTSREWKPGNTYGPDTEPDYSTLSYTWGRFQIPNGPRLSIKGIDWQIPSISEYHFTVADLRRLLQQMMLKHDYAWIDIACIDQKREKEKMLEVGRQASIFKLARQSYVWLNKYEPEILTDYMQALMRCGYDLSYGVVDIRQAVEDMIRNLSLLLQDPWFSSLWTLQELLLQRHAILLNKRGEPVTTHGPWNGEFPSTQLLDVSEICRIVGKLTDQAMQTGSNAGQDGSLSPQQENLQTLRRIIDESGLDFTLCPNPNIQYAAARFRKTSYLEDRIYAIMQVYGYRLGNSATSLQRIRHFGLEELELQFLTTLTSQSVVLSQAFQHREVPEVGQSWCLTNRIRVPERLHKILVHDQFLTSACRIKVVRKSEAYFEGQACTLREFLGVWKERSQRILARLISISNAPQGLKDRHLYLKDSSYMIRFLKLAKQGIIMDCGEPMLSEWPPDTTVLDENADPIVENRTSELTHAAETQQNLGEAMITRHGNSMPRVLYLGMCKYIEIMAVALIVVREGRTRSGFLMGKKDIWRRIGICFWYLELGPGDDLTKLLQPLKGRFG